MTSYFLHKSLFTIFITLAQHPFSDFFCLCMKMPQTATDDCAVSRCIPVRLLCICTLMALSPLIWPEAPPRLVHRSCASEYRQSTFPSACIWLCSGPLASPWHRASPEWKSQCNLFLCSWFPFWAFGPCWEEDGSLATAPRSGSMLLCEKGKSYISDIALLSFARLNHMNQIL